MRVTILASYNRIKILFIAVDKGTCREQKKIQLLFLGFTYQEINRILCDPIVAVQKLNVFPVSVFYTEISGASLTAVYFMNDGDTAVFF